MQTPQVGYSNILVAIDFSPHSDAALKQAVWLARKNPAKVVLAHALRDLRRAVCCATYEAKCSLFYGGGEHWQREIRTETDEKLRRMFVDLNAMDLDTNFETLLGEPFVELTHAVQAEGYDLVLAGTRGLAAWEEFFVGSTAKRLIRKCPTSVWIVKVEHAEPPKVVLAGTDFSDVSLKAVTQGLWVAQQADAEFHLLHVIDSMDVSEDVIAKMPRSHATRHDINDGAEKRFDAFLESVPCERDRIQVHLSWGTAWQEVRRMAEQVRADLIAMGTVGRSGIQGLLLGNTAEKVLGACECSILTVKPAGFVSPIGPAFWPLHPDQEEGSRV
jgi:nucleotide-binding universal stress UspA family protein